MAPPAPPAHMWLGSISSSEPYGPEITIVIARQSFDYRWVSSFFRRYDVFYYNTGYIHISLIQHGTTTGPRAARSRSALIWHDIALTKFKYSARLQRGRRRWQYMGMMGLIRARGIQSPGLHLHWETVTVATIVSLSPLPTNNQRSHTCNCLSTMTTLLAGDE